MSNGCLRSSENQRKNATDASRNEKMNMQNKKLVENYINQYNSKNIDAMLELFSEDAQFESVSNTSGVIKTGNKKQLRELALMSVEYFEQRRQTILSWVIGDSHVAIEIEYLLV